MFQTVDPGVAAIYSLAVQKGVMVADVAANSPAQASGLQTNDVVVTINTTDVTTASQLADQISASQIGQKVTITYWRGNSKSTIEVVPVQNPTP